MSEGRITPLEPLLRYFVKHRHVRSLVWMTKLCEIVGRLLQYIEANRREGDKPVNVFEGFVNALYNGTFGENNEDPSGLCWFASNTKTVNQKLYMLEEFSEWMVQEKYALEPLNPWSTATSSEQRFNWIAWYLRNEHSFLGHLGVTKRRSEAMEQARMIKLRRQPMSKPSEPKAFPSNFETALLRDGFVRPGKDGEADILEKFDWRGICIAMLLLYGGKRLSEPFHLWIGDVMENPARPGEALVRIYHPSHGQAPENPKINGRRAANRQAYLQAFYPSFLPRDIATGNYHAGFKGRAFTDDKAKFLHVYWFPSFMAEAFLHAYHNYMLQRARMGIDGSRHPFAFVSHSKKYKGQPYSIKSFESTWARAIKRIGLPYGKIHGTTPHGGRHAVGLRANRGGVNQYDAQEMFGHSSPESQRTYLVPSADDVTKSLEAATVRLQAKDDDEKTNLVASPDWMDIWHSQEDRESKRYLRAAWKRK